MRPSQPPALFMLLMIAINRPMISTPSMKPATGEEIIGTTTFQKMPEFLPKFSPARAQIKACQLLSAAATAAPHRPPISAWLDDDGRPRHQVIRFQMMAPTSAQISTCEVTITTSVSTRPEAMVLATAVPRKAPIRFVTAASITACVGVSTLVATTVAIELAVSWKPLMNSNTNAVTMTSRSKVSTGLLLGVLQHDLVHHVAGIAAAVDGFFQKLEQVFQDQVAHRVGFECVSVAVQLEDQAVRLGLDRLHLVVQRLAGIGVHALAQQADHFLDDFGGALEHVRARDEVHVAQPLGRQRVALGELLDDLRDLVQGARQGIDVLALKRGHERIHQLMADLRGQVLLALAGQLELLERPLRRGSGQQLHQGPGAFPRRGSACLEQPVELVALAEDGLERKHDGSCGVAGQ